VTETPTGERTDKSIFQLTRELELLISVALVFALLQFPVVLDDWFNRHSIHVGGVSFGVVFTLYYVGKLVSYGLIVAISTHILLRGFWVAVMSLRSVSPPVDLDRIDQGKVMRRFYENRLMTLDELERRVDRVAASIFSFIFLFLLLFLMLSVWAGLAWLTALIVSGITGNDNVVLPVIACVFCVYILLQSFVGIVDKVSRKRDLSPRMENAALRVMRWMYYVTFNFIYAPVFLTFASQSSRRRVSALLVGFLYTMIGFFVVSVFFAVGLFGYDSYVYYPAQSGPHQVRASHYDNLRAGDSPATEPSIQSEIVTGAHLRLFMPYDAREDNARMKVLCPEVAPLRGSGFFVSKKGKLEDTRVAELAACFGKAYEIALDGQAVKPDFVFYRHPAGGVAGRLALLPIQSLAPGRHLLTVRHTPLPGVKEDEKADEFFIPFWR
jgi:hypothetical protein